jgi:hypothetical protein
VELDDPPHRRLLEDICLALAQADEKSGVCGQSAGRDRLVSDDLVEER